MKFKRSASLQYSHVKTGRNGSPFAAHQEIFEARMRPNPYSSSTIDMCGKRGFGTLFSDFLRFFEIFYRAGRTGALLAGIKGKEKAFAVIRK